MTLTKEELKSALKDAVAWCKSNLRKHLPAEVADVVPYDKIKLEIGKSRQMGYSEMCMTPKWVLKVDLRRLKWYHRKQMYLEKQGIKESTYDAQSVMVHEIVEAALREHFRFYAFSAYFHLLAQVVEDLNRKERGIGRCPLCASDIRFITNTRSPRELFDACRVMFENPMTNFILRATARPFG